MNKTAVVTGATSGIGFAAAKQLACMGIHVIGIGRNPDRCRIAKSALTHTCPDAKVDFIVGDLSTTVEVRRIAADIRPLLGGSGKLHILLHAAGTVSSWYVDTPEAFELQFAVNHLAPFLLTSELMPELENAPSARVLVISSESHYHTRIRWKDVMMRRHYSCLAAYKQSKLFNVLFTGELARRLDGSTIWSYAIDPGLVRTEIGLKGTAGIERKVWLRRMKSGTHPDVPASYLVSIATDPAYAGRSGRYWRDGEIKKPSLKARSPKKARRLWALSEQLTG